MQLEQLLAKECAKAVVREDQEMRDLLNTLDREGKIKRKGDIPLADGESKRASMHDMVFEAYVNSMLSSPKTQLINAISNTVPLVTRLMETTTAAGISKFAGRETDRVTFNEAMAELTGLGEGIKEAMWFASKRLSMDKRSNEQLLSDRNIPSKLAVQAKIERQNQAITGDHITRPFLKKTVDTLGFAFNMPGKFLSSSDTFFKIINYRAEISKQAMRKAANENISAKDIKKSFETYKSAAIKSGDENQELVAKGIQDADIRTYTNKPVSTLDQWMAHKGTDVPGLRWFVPFHRTLSNLISYGLSRTMLPAVEAGASKIPWVKNLMPESATARALMEGTQAEKSEAIARMTVGTGLISATGFFLNDYIDGGGPKSNTQAMDLWRKDGHKPYTIEVAGQKFSLDSLGPYGFMLKAYADVRELMSNSSIEDEGSEKLWTEVTGELTMALSDVLVNEHWMSNLIDAFTAVSKSLQYEDPGYIINLGVDMAANTAIPLANLTHQAAKLIDPQVKEKSDNPFDRVIRKIPFWSATLPPKISLWGDPMRYDNWQNADYVNPIDGKDPVSVAMRKIGFEIPKVTRAGMGTKMTSEEFSRFQVLAGKGPMGMVPLRDKIIQVMNSDTYRRFASVKGKHNYLKSVISQYREAARFQLYKEAPGFKQRVDQARQQKIDDMRLIP